MRIRVTPTPRVCTNASHLTGVVRCIMVFFHAFRIRYTIISCCAVCAGSWFGRAVDDHWGEKCGSLDVDVGQLVWVSHFLKFHFHVLNCHWVSRYAFVSNDCHWKVTSLMTHFPSLQQNHLETSTHHSSIIGASAQNTSVLLNKLPTRQTSNYCPSFCFQKQ